MVGLAMKLKKDMSAFVLLVSKDLTAKVNDKWECRWKNIFAARQCTLIVFR